MMTNNTIGEPFRKIVEVNLNRREIGSTGSEKDGGGGGGGGGVERKSRGGGDGVEGGGIGRLKKSVEKCVEN
jgi:hypothetical protein